MTSGEHEKFMAVAIEEARSGLRGGEEPFGSVIIRDGEIVGRAHNIEASSGDPTAHAETEAVRNAAANLETRVLKGCTLYTSCDPCPMCAGAALNAGIDRIVIGARFEPLARMRGIKPRAYSAEQLADMLHKKLEAIRGVLQDEAEEVLAEYDWKNAQW